jgi:glyoxylase-like metal-dependent hydrolase (beta-lactamase superfamily II)
MTDQHDTVTLVPNQGWDPRVLVCRCGPIVDAFVVVSARFVVLIDTMISPQTAQAMFAIARPHLAGGRQLLVVNTHVDWDHFWGNQLFAGPQAIHPAPIFASRHSAARFRDEEATQRFLAEMRAQRPGRYDDVQVTRPTVFFDDRLQIDGGDLTLELFPTPGHQPDHVAILIPEIGTLLAGDAAEFPFPFPEAATTLPLLRDSLARMAALDPATVLYCHAPVTSGPGLLRENIAYFDTLEQRCREALARGVPANPDADADVEELVGFPFASAIPEHGADQPPPDVYRTGHQAAIRMMLEYLQTEATR